MHEPLRPGAHEVTRFTAHDVPRLHTRCADCHYQLTLFATEQQNVLTSSKESACRQQAHTRKQWQCRQAREKPYPTTWNVSLVASFAALGNLTLTSQSAGPGCCASSSRTHSEFATSQSSRPAANVRARGRSLQWCYSSDPAVDNSSSRPKWALAAMISRRPLGQRQRSVETR